MAKENDRGCIRIQGELHKLGIKVAYKTIRKVLINNGFHPTPWRHRADWHKFLKRHADTLWACDFFTKDVWTAWGKVTYYVLFFIHVGARRVRIAGSTCHPDGPWVEQQAQNLFYELAERNERATALIHDRDTKFTVRFKDIIKSEGVKVVRIPYRAPNLNAFAERYVRTAKSECLNHFVVFGQRHLDYLLREFETFYNTVRPHQGLRNRTIGITALPSPGCGPPARGEVVCEARLGGLLRHYHRKAA